MPSRTAVGDVGNFMSDALATVIVTGSPSFFSSTQATFLFFTDFMQQAMTWSAGSEGMPGESGHCAFRALLAASIESTCMTGDLPETRSSCICAIWAADASAGPLDAAHRTSASV